MGEVGGTVEGGYGYGRHDEEINAMGGLQAKADDDVRVGYY